MMRKEMTVRGREVGRGKQTYRRTVAPFHASVSLAAYWSSLGDGAGNSSEVQNRLQDELSRS
jgi:hypothetical protein